MFKAIVVDDEEVIVKGLVQLIPWQKYGCEVVATAYNGTEALKLVESDPPDILITDICMPQMDGLALIAALRSQYPKLQVTILSGYPEFDFAQKAMSMGVCRYLLKPSKYDQLEEALACMVEQLKKAQDAVEAADEDDDSSVENSHNFIIRNAMQYIEEHFSEKITLLDVADHVYVSQWHLSKLITKNTNQSFSDLINSVRIQKAKELMSDPSLRIWEIGEMVGFSDVSHFSRIFKKYEFLSPTEYRNKLSMPEA